MLESMVTKPRPTRAESSDVANAVLDGADCIMLSGETAKGKYPLEAVRTMASISREAESAIHHRQLFSELRALQPAFRYPQRDAALAAVEAAITSLAACILVTTDTGRSAVLLAAFRPRCPIMAVSRDPVVARQLHLYRGVYPVLDGDPVLAVWVDDMDRRLQLGLGDAWQRGIVQGGAYVVVVTGWRPGPGSTNTVRIIQVPQQSAPPRDLHVLRQHAARPLPDLSAARGAATSVGTSP